MKFTYFAARGLGETIRLLLKYGNLEFEDERIPMADWPKIKPSTPFGQIPILEENGKVAGQSIAIARYIAKKVNLVGNNDWENLEIDAVGDTLNDLKNKLLDVGHEKDDETKKKLKETAIKETVPYYYERFDKMAKENNGHLAANKLTWVDFLFTTTSDIAVDILEKDLIENYPNLQTVKRNVVEIPAVKKWIETRPKTQF